MALSVGGDCFVSARVCVSRVCVCVCVCVDMLSFRSALAIVLCECVCARSGLTLFFYAGPGPSMPASSVCAALGTAVAQALPPPATTCT